MDAEIGKRVEKVFREVFQLDSDSLSDGMGPDDILTWDSMGHVTLVAALEQEFDMSFEMEEILEIRVVGDAKKTISKHLHSAS